MARLLYKSLLWQWGTCFVGAGIGVGFVIPVRVRESISDPAEAKLILGIAWYVMIALLAVGAAIYVTAIIRDIQRRKSENQRRAAQKNTSDDKPVDDAL